MSDNLLNPVKPSEEISEADAERIINNAIAKLKGGDNGAHWKPEVIEAARWLHQNDQPLFQCKRSELKASSQESQITEWTREVKQSDYRQEDSTKSGVLVELAQESSTLFHDPAGECFASFEQEGHWENWSLSSTGFKDWLSYKAYRELGFVPSDTAIKAALTALRGIATHDGDELNVFLRCAPWKNGYLIDLTNNQWQAVEVLPTGWRVIDTPPVKFIRSQTAAPLPLPVSGDLDMLWQYANIPAKDRTLVLAFMLDSWRPDTPYPMLFISGEQGSGKSSTHKHIRQVSDPNTVPLRAAPKSIEDVFVSASTNHQASFENMSNLPTALQDALCTLATGGGFAKRKLYSDSDESVIELKRPVIINGISDSVTRSDLIDRTLHIETPPLKDMEEEQDFEEGFERDRAIIYGGLLDLFVKVLELLPGIQLTVKPRMVGFTKLGEAIHKALGIKDQSFTDIYLDNRSESLARSLDSSPAAVAIQEMMLSRGNMPWTGTVKSLKTELDNNYHQDGEGWPKSAKGLGDVLRRMMMPALRGVDIVVEFLGHKRDGWHVHISFEQKNSSVTNGHNGHMVTDGPNTDLNSDDSDSERDRVTIVTVKSEDKKELEKDIYPESSPSPDDLDNDEQRYRV